MQSQCVTLILVYVEIDTVLTQLRLKGVLIRGGVFFLEPHTVDVVTPDAEVTVPHLGSAFLPSLSEAYACCASFLQWMLTRLMTYAESINLVLRPV